MPNSYVQLHILPSTSGGGHVDNSLECIWALALQLPTLSCKLGVFISTKKCRPQSLPFRKKKHTRDFWPPTKCRKLKLHGFLCWDLWWCYLSCLLVNHHHVRQTRWWFQKCLYSPLFGEDSHFDWYFWDGLKPPTWSSCKAKHVLCSSHPPQTRTPFATPFRSFYLRLDTAHHFGAIHRFGHGEYVTWVEMVMEMDHVVSKERVQCRESNVICDRNQAHYTCLWMIWFNLFAS